MIPQQNIKQNFVLKVSELFAKNIFDCNKLLLALQTRKYLLLKYVK